METVDDTDDAKRDNVKHSPENERNDSINFLEEQSLDKSPSLSSVIEEIKSSPSLAQESTQSSTSVELLGKETDSTIRSICEEEEVISQLTSDCNTAEDEQTPNDKNVIAQCPMEIDGTSETINNDQNLKSNIETDPSHNISSSVTLTDSKTVLEEHNKDCPNDNTIHEDNSSSTVEKTSMTIENDSSTGNALEKSPSNISQGLVTEDEGTQSVVSHTPGLSITDDQSSFLKLQSDSDSSESVETSSESSDSETSESEESNKEDCGKKDFVKKKTFKDKNKLKGELDLEDLPPIEDLHITVTEEECEPLGKVYSIVNQLVVVESLPNTPALDLDSILFRAKGVPFGHIFDVFGPVKSPYYCVRFNSNSDILDKGIQTGELIYCAPQTEHTKYVFTYQLMKQKGSDASWKHNHEPPPHLIEYSDDEEERNARNRNKKAETYKTEDPDGPRRKHLKVRNWNNKFANHTVSDGFRQSVRPMMLPQAPMFIPPIPVRPATPGPFSAPPATRMAPPFETRPHSRPPMMNGSPARPHIPPHFQSMPSRPPFAPAASQFPSRPPMIGPSPFPPPPSDFPPHDGIHSEGNFSVRPQPHPLAQRGGFHGGQGVPPFPQNTTPPRPPPPSAQQIHSPPTQVVSSQPFRSGMTLPPFSSSCRPPPRQAFAPPRPPPFTQRSYPVFGQQPLFPPAPSPPPSYHPLPFPNNRPPFP